jgi:hypothetical protein
VSGDVTDHSRSEFAKALEGLLYAHSRRGKTARHLATLIAQAEGRASPRGGRWRGNEAERRNRIRRWERRLSDWRHGKSLPSSPEILQVALAEIASPRERQHLSALWWTAKAAQPSAIPSTASPPPVPPCGGDHDPVEEGEPGPSPVGLLELSDVASPAGPPRVLPPASSKRQVAVTAVLAMAWVGVVLVTQPGIVRSGQGPAVLVGLLAIVAGGALAARDRSVVPDGVRVAWAAEDLVTATATSWRRQAQGWAIDRDVIPVRWCRDGGADDEALRPPVAGQGPLPLPDAPQGQDAEPVREGSVGSLYHDVYLRLPRGRLVIVGARGSGKTAAMALLLLAAVQHLQTLARTSPDRVAAAPVPVWLSLASWDPRRTSLFDWARDTLEREYPFLGDRTLYGSSVTRRLLEQGRVALLLDGLDEMPASLRGIALDRIDRNTAVRLVLTSRLSEYEEATRHGHLRDAVVVRLCAVDTDVIRDYLQRGHSTERARQWAEIADHLAAHPGGVLANALDQPLMINLARDAYASHADAAHRDTDPRALVDHPQLTTPETVRSHLIEQLFVRAYPDEPSRRHTLRWLGWLASTLDRSPDILWWDLPRRVRGSRVFTDLLLGLLTAVVCTLGVVLVHCLGLRVEDLPILDRVTAGLNRGLMHGLPAGVTVALLAGLTRGRRSGIALGLGVGIVSEIGYALARGDGLVIPAPGQDDTGVVLGMILGTGLLYALVGFFLGGLRTWHVNGPKNLRTRRPRRPGWLSELTLGSSLGGAIGCATGWLLISPYHYGVSWELAVTAMFTVGGLLVGAAGTALLSTWVRPVVETHAVLTVDRSYADDRRSALGVAVTVGTVITVLAILILGTIYCPLHGLRHGLATSCSFGLVAGVVAGVTIGLGSHHSTYLRGAELVLCLRGQGRIRFIPLLANAHAAHVLRRSGVALQFRHEDIHRHLKEHHCNGAPSTLVDPGS